jgi:hypothetical protein
VIASMGHMPWAPPDRRAQILKWTTAVERAARAKAIPEAAGRWHVLRYERLRADTRAEVIALFDFLELPWDDDLIATIVHDTEFTRMQQSRHDTRHRRRGVAGGWRDELTPEEIALFEELAQAALVTSGYPPQ